MPLNLHRLPTGLIYSQTFADYLAARHGQEHAVRPGEVLHLDYVRCAQGELKGQSWWQLGWLDALRAPSEHRYQIGCVEVFIHRQAMTGLKNRLLHFDGARVVVKK